MRQEDKEIDGFDLEQEEERRRENELVEEDDEALHDLDGKPELAGSAVRAVEIGDAMRTILAREHIVVNDLQLTQRELRALEALKTAVDGRDQEIHSFVYAEDRRTLLEQALAILQPDLAALQQVGGKPFDELLHEVAGLREQLDELEDAQEEVVAPRQDVTKGEDEGDKDDDEDDDEDADEDGGEEVTDDTSRGTSLTGPERTEAAKPTSSLTGPERSAPAKPPSSLTGPERTEAAKPTTTLGDPKEIADAARPWWKR